MLGMRESALLRRVQRGSVKGSKVGWVWIIHKDEVERILGERVAAQ